MERILKPSITCIVVVLISFSSNAFVNITSPHSSSKIPQSQVVKPSPFAGMTINEFLNLTPRKYRELTGEKMSFSQKLALKLAQRKVKRLVNKNKPIDLMAFTRAISGNDFHIPGFILGVVLGPLGILIAYLIEGKTSAMFQWALIGALIWLGLFLLVVVFL